MGTAAIVILAVLDVPVFIAIGWCFFGDWMGFVRTLWAVVVGLFWGSPMIDEEGDRIWQPLKLVAFLVTCGAVAYVEFLLLSWLGWA
jgi:hypothetical protein